MVIGLSLSGCVKDILEGKVAVGDVDVIVARTRCVTEEDFAEVCRMYEESFWHGNGAGTLIAATLYFSDRIAQPRLMDKHEPIPNKTYSLTTDPNRNWVKSMEDIKWVNTR